MERRIVNNINELQVLLGEKMNFEYSKPFTFDDFDFNFDLGQNFFEFKNLIHSNNNGSIANSFSSIKHYIFVNCKFSYELKLFEKIELKLQFENNCEFNNLNFEDVSIDKNIKFYECHFKGQCNFQNTKFLNLADFWNSTFYEPISFYKTDFLGTTVFSACTFYENVLFTYSLFKDKILFRGANFKKGLDLSLSINSGEYNFFNISLKNFKSVISSDETDYTNLINDDKIPTINKKETFRIIKQYFNDNGDDLEYVKYLSLEKKPIYEIIINNFINTKRKNWWNYIHHFFDLISLGLNRISNNNRNSYLLGIVFTVLMGIIFFSLTLLSLPNFELYWEPSNWKKVDLWKEYLTFMNPTHEIKLFDNLSPNGWTYFWQTWGRIFVGYGIYQTVQAFRKLK
jgi:hypothetical protein